MEDTTQTRGSDELAEEAGGDTGASEAAAKPIDEPKDEAAASAGDAAGRENGSGVRERKHERATERDQRIGEERLSQAREIAEEMRHKRGCPEEGALPGDEHVRVEFFVAQKPKATESLPPEEWGKKLIVVRCIECGEAESDYDGSEGKNA
jgi:hypothetical protein